MAITSNRINGNSATIKVGDVDIQVTSDPKSNGDPVINIRSNRGPAHINYANVRGGFDPASVSASRTTKGKVEPTPTTPASAPTTPAKKHGLFSRMGAAVAAPFKWAAGLGKKSRFGAKALGTGAGVATAASAVTTGAFITNMLAPQLIHGVLLKVGMLGLLGPQSAALIPAIAFGALTLFLGAQAIAMFRGAKKPAAPVKG